MWISAFRTRQRSKSATQYVRFNQIFSEGDLPQGQSLSAVIGTQTVPLQMDVLSRYADGSVKSAILTIAAPAIAAGATLQGSLVASSAAAGAAVANDAALAQGYDLTVNMNISGFGAVTINAAQKLAAAVAGGDFEVLRQGALATEIRFDVAVTRALRVTFDVVTYADGSVSTKVGFQNDAAMGATGGAILFNSLSIVEGGTTRFSTTNLTQYQYQVWAQDITEDSSARQTLNVRHDIDYLERTGAIWNYDLTATVSAAPSVPSSWTNVLGDNGLYRAMPTTGGRPDIGPTTEANARWLITQDASAATLRPGPGAGRRQHSLALLRHGERPLPLGHRLSHAVDRLSRQRPAHTDRRRRIGLVPRPRAQPRRLLRRLAADRRPLPSRHAERPGLLGDRQYLERPAAERSRASSTNAVEEVRAQAWSLRTVQEAAYANPDGSYEKAYFTQIANNNWAHLRARTATLSCHPGRGPRLFRGHLSRPTGRLAPWQQDFFASTAALAALQGNEDARAVLKWQANFLSGRFLSPDLNPYNGFNYWLNVYGSNGKALTSWAEVAAATRAAGNYATGPFAGHWAELAAMSNANIITVFAGGEDPTDHRVAADAMRAYGWILGSGMPDLRTDPQYQVVPRMPDGTQIGVTEMRVVAPTAQNTTLTFTGDNVFAYDQRHWPHHAERHGRRRRADRQFDQWRRPARGPGGDDYLIGGTGTNVFAPGDGQDYALIRGGAARFEVSAASPGRLEIEGFRPGTDIIALTGTVSLASILASARSDGFGGTLLTISPGRTIRLNGVTPSKITAGMFDIR